MKKKILALFVTAALAGTALATLAACGGNAHNAQKFSDMPFPDIAILAALTPTAVIVVLVLILLIFGGKKLPELARGLGKARREFKKASEELEDEVKSVIEDEERADVRRKLIEEEERKKIRARIEAEERAKFEAEKAASATDEKN